jgi:uncharacterized repeat protein (TIGR03803 family)
MNIAKALIGRASCVLALLAVGFGARIASAQSDGVTFTTLRSFDYEDGARPTTGLVQATNGDLYGPTQIGPNHTGTIFKITPDGTLTTVYVFCPSGDSCEDGKYPLAGLVQTANGDLYGTTYLGGEHAHGTVFKITLSGMLTTLYSFCSIGNCTDGAGTYGALVRGTDGDFYGTTVGGGAYGFFGTVFKMTPTGTLTTLHSFCSQAFPCADGQGPAAGLVQASNGDFYGTTTDGGANNAGTVFKITPTGTLTTLHSFCSQSGCTDGSLPYGLVQATDGDLYGITTDGGANSDGTVFKITPSGTLTTLYSFCSQSGCTDGEGPSAGLIQATDGDFYGTTFLGGASNSSCQFGTCGTVFKITPGGALTTLHTFDSSDGANPQGVLVQDTEGTFYGTTAWGGANGYGTAFSLSVGLGAFVEMRPGVGIAGVAVQILGSDLTGATSVTFNGTPATILYDAPTVIYAKVPAGATTGKVQVVTPNGTLTSNVAFEVVP